MAASLLRPPRIDRLPLLSAVTPGCSLRTSLIRSIGRLSANWPSTRCFVVTSSRGTSGWVWLTTVISVISTAVCSNWMSTVIVWPARILLPSTWVDLYPMKAARTETGPAGTLLMK